MTNGFQGDARPDGYSLTSGFGVINPADSSFANHQYDRGDQIDLNELQNYIHSSPIKPKRL